MRHSRTSISLAAALLVGAAALAAGDGKKPDARADARLDRPVSITTSYCPLNEFCGKLADMAGVAISVDPAVRDNKVIARIKEQPLRDVMRQVAALSDFDWTQSADDPPAYRLTQSDARAALGPSMRERFFAEKLARTEELFRNALKAAVMSVDERRELARTDPDAVALAVTKPVVCQALATLDSAKLDTFLNRAETRIPVSVLPAETRASLKQSILDSYKEREEDINEADWLWDEAVIRMRRVEHRFPWGLRSWIEVPSAKVKGEVETTSADDLEFRPAVSWAGLERWQAARAKGEPVPSRGVPSQDVINALARDCEIDISAKAQEEAAGRLPEWAGPAAREPAPQPSGTLVALELNPAEFNDVKPEAPLLLTIADKLDVNLIADCYWTAAMVHYWLRGFGRSGYPLEGRPQTEISVDADPEYTLSQMCQPRVWRWTRDGAFFRIRNAMWFVDDAEEVPASALREWMRRTNHETHVTIDDYLFLVNALTEIQARNLGGTHYNGRLYRAGVSDERRYDMESRVLWRAEQLSFYGGYPAVRLYSLLSPELRVRAETTGLLVGSELPADVRPLAHRIAEVQSEVDNHPFRGSAKEIAAMVNGARLWAGWRWDMSVDAEIGFRPSPALSIELRSGGKPNWNGASDEQGHLWGCSLSQRLGGEAGPAERKEATAVAAAALPQEPQYVRVQVSPTATAYVEFRGSQMRIAPTAAGLAKAEPVAASDVSGRFAVFPPVSLPVAATGTADGTALAASFMVGYPSAAAGDAAVPAHAYAGFKVEREDAKLAVYTYASAVESAVASSAEKAPVMLAADPSGLRLEVVAQPSPGRIDAGLRVSAEGLRRFDLRRNGGALEAQFRVLDSKGKVVKSDSGPLEIFGFT